LAVLLRRRVFGAGYAGSDEVDDAVHPAEKLGAGWRCSAFADLAGLVELLNTTK
jgi:hypothetical protein